MLTSQVHFFYNNQCISTKRLEHVPAEGQYVQFDSNKIYRVAEVRHVYSGVNAWIDIGLVDYYA